MPLSAPREGEIEYKADDARKLVLRDKIGFIEDQQPAMEAFVRKVRRARR